MANDNRPMFPIGHVKDTGLEKKLEDNEDKIAAPVPQTTNPTPIAVQKKNNLSKITLATIAVSGLGTILYFFGNGIYFSEKAHYIVENSKVIETIYDPSVCDLKCYLELENIPPRAREHLIGKIKSPNCFGGRLEYLNPGLRFEIPGEHKVYLPDLDGDGKVGR